MNKPKTAPKKGTRTRKTPGFKIPKGAVGIDFLTFAAGIINDPHDYRKGRNMSSGEFHKRISDPEFRKEVSAWVVEPLRKMFHDAPKELTERIDWMEKKTTEYLAIHSDEIKDEAEKKREEILKSLKDMRKSIHESTKDVPFWIKVVAAIMTITEIGWRIFKVLVVAFVIAYGIHWYISLFTR